MVRAGAGRVLRARGQSAHAVGRLLHAREPRDHDAAVPGAVRARTASRRSSTIPTSCCDDAAQRGAARAVERPDRRAADAGRITTAPTTSTRSSPTQMGIELVEGIDLFVRRRLRLHAHDAGPQRVDVIYRRIDDDFLDPLVFRPDSAARRAGPDGAYRAGNVTHRQRASAPASPTTRSIYSYVPEMIRFYLGEEPMLKNVPTWRCARRRRPAATCSTICTSWW